MWHFAECHNARRQYRPRVSAVCCCWLVLGKTRGLSARSVDELSEAARDALKAVLRLLKHPSYHSGIVVAEPEIVIQG